MSTWLLTLALLTAGAEPAKAVPGKAPWPGNARLIESQLSVEAAKASSTMSLPQLRIYDAQGRRVSSETGYDSGFAKTLGKIFDGEAEPDARHPLSEDLAKIVTAEGKPLSVDRADFTLVKYWAEWCVPCHAQTSDLKKLLAAYPKLTFNVVHVEADRSKILTGKPVTPLKLDAETLKKLDDPNLTPEERQKLLEEIMAAKGKG
jgi:thiol-disulfide isomerase/thioredoxin